ncbi:LLM class flavin-dependent oxidoreductase [Mycobacterium yunnanensis]|uniref:LLM class flavin-dependent oxidoreductase n=1 Tax=Mycobacterium yunnanensis TaxID=368477 RepID=A0A9X2YUN8_9MYCO|nr:LLM class flavin-dependent oxidoreductase [Mycobacterium yunnanensis]MCV7419275.1 LLM class flavin-dependent oxidoreductase [Mycobacterium yunnanensis]
MPAPLATDLAEGRSHLAIYDDENKLKLGTFATNVSYGLSISEAPTTYEVSWEHTRKLARQSDAMGLDMVVPVSRWRGFGGATNFNGESFDTYTWAAGLAQVTERIMVFATSHVPVIHPIVAAKQAATVDHISNGRFGLNLVMGWFTPELEMFGSSQREHDERYRVGDEWLHIVKRLWTEEDPFSVDGAFYSVKDAQSWPKPIQRPHPVIMNAGASPAGSDFSARHADVSFIAVKDPATAAERIQRFKSDAFDKYHRNPLVFSGAYVVCADTEEEAHDQLRSVVDGGDREAARNLMQVLGIQSGSFDEILAQATEDAFITGWGTPVFLGTPEQITDRLIGLENAGISGVTLGFHDYERGLEHFGESVLPLLRQAGLRA